VASASPAIRWKSILGDRFGVIGQLIRRPAGAVSLGVVVGIVLVAFLAPLLAPYDPKAIDVHQVFEGPSRAHWLGTDYIGRDMLSRILFGARTALDIALPAVVIGFACGLPLGLLAGYLGGAIDKTVIVLMDAIISFPAVILALAVLTFLGPSQGTLIGLIAIAFVPGYARLARAQTFAIKQNPYIKAERSLGASRTRIVVRHIVPNIITPLIILMAMDIPGAVGVEAGLAFIGIGIQPPTADWGVMLNDGFTYVRTSIWGLIGPLTALFLITAAFTVLGETLRDIMDPKLAGTRRRLRMRLRGVQTL
jgi:peptide/nickel transport system permease protein